MSNAPIYEIDPEKFWADPYPDLARMRDQAPIAYVPQLDATLLTRHADIALNEKKTDVFSSVQPQGLMTVLMGENLMRKDGREHMAERRAIYPSMSPQTVRDVWDTQFRMDAEEVAQGLVNEGRGDLFWTYAMPVSARALKAITGLTNMDATEMNRVSQGMIDGCANYSGDVQVEAHCHDCTASIDSHIDARLSMGIRDDDVSLLATQVRAGLSDEQMRANIKLSISGGQNEPRDAIAGTIWALLRHPEQLKMCLSGTATWLQVFEEYARWISPIAMSPRRVAQVYEYAGVTFEPEDKVFLMFGSANRDTDVFDHADRFDITRDTSKSLSFGAGPHYCAGAWASRTLIADVALPTFFEYFPRVEIDAEVPFGGWAFRGPLALPCRWDGR
ncbi:MAG: cytochrome P450 [Pseudomonadota bacterium]|nr:cytochrome P450 [Pseudomonadota bacterium]